MRTVKSKDGTRIAFDQLGNGPVVILVGGATTTRADTYPLAEALAPHFTVLNYDRRGRDDSGDTAPYAVEREVEDIEALIDAAGQTASLFGHSSGAVLALEAARQLPDKIGKLALYEPPFIVDDSRPPVPTDYVAQLNAAVAAGRPGDALAIFMTQAVGMPAEVVPQMREAPFWATSEAVAHTIAYDGTIMGDTMRGNPAALQKWRSVRNPTLVIDGGESAAWMHRATQALADVLPNAQRLTLAGQTHGAATEVLAPVLVTFFAGQGQAGHDR
ncbi:MAG: alpha/beta hydrolase [Anaerolineae bacterium]